MQLCFAPTCLQAKCNPAPVSQHYPSVIMCLTSSPQVLLRGYAKVAESATKTVFQDVSRGGQVGGRAGSEPSSGRLVSRLPGARVGKRPARERIDPIRGPRLHRSGRRTHAHRFQRLKALTGQAEFSRIPSSCRAQMSNTRPGPLPSQVRPGPFP